jgi:tetratricopeptide (TPR) repeat protein
MRKELILALFMLATVLLVLSCVPTKRTQHIISPDVALVVESRPASDDLEMDKPEIDMEEEVKEEVEQEIEKEEAVIKRKSADDYNNLGVSYKNKGKYDEAIVAYKQAIKINPDYGEAYNNLGSAYSELGMYKEAVGSYKKATNLIKPNHAGAHYNLGFAHLMLEDDDSALREYKILKTLNPEMADKLSQAAIQKAESDKNSRYKVQVGAFAILNNAKILIERLRDDYLYVHIEKEDNLNKVRIIGIKTRTEGNLIMNNIKHKFRIKPFMISAH